LREGIHVFKYGRNIYSGEKLANFLIDGFERKFDSDTFDYILPVPLHKKRLRIREFNQAVILSKVISEKYSIPILLDFLIRRRNTKSQTNLTVSERRRNIVGAFSFKKFSKNRFLKSFSNIKKRIINIKGKRVLLVDDVLTTGITTNECAGLLKAKGVSFVGVLAVAKTVHGYVQE